MSDLNLCVPLKIIVYGYKEAVLKSIADVDVKEVNGVSTPRWWYFSKYQNSWVLFIDKDCSLLTETVETLKERIPSLDKNVVYAGHYRTAIGAPAQAVSYNLICNHWYNIGDTQNDPRLLGGCFLIYCSEKFLSDDFQRQIYTIPKWGAEDFHFSRILKKMGCQILSLNFLSVVHRPNFKILRFFRRAFLHGFNRPIDSSSNQKNVSAWMKTLKGVGPFSQFFILLHLTTVSIGVIVSKIQLLLRSPFQNNKTQEQKY